jgi:hypothetical protein
MEKVITEIGAMFTSIGVILIPILAKNWADFHAKRIEKLLEPILEDIQKIKSKIGI